MRLFGRIWTVRAAFVLWWFVFTALTKFILLEVWQWSRLTDSPALTVMASMNWSLQLLVPTSRARLVFLISLSTVFCQEEWGRRTSRRRRKRRVSDVSGDNHWNGGLALGGS